MDTEHTNWLTHPVVWAAGLAGAMVSLAHAPAMTLRLRAGTLLVGLLTAGFVTPALADQLKLSVNSVAALAFVLGIAGMFLTAVVFNLATKFKENPDLALRWFLAVRSGQVPGVTQVALPPAVEVKPPEKPPERVQTAPSDPPAGGVGNR